MWTTRNLDINESFYEFRLFLSSLFGCLEISLKTLEFDFQQRVDHVSKVLL